MCVCICVRAHILVHVFVDEFLFRCHLLISNIQCVCTRISLPSVICFIWPTTIGNDSNKVAFVSCYWQLRHFCVFLRPVLCVFVYIYISFCAVKMLVHIFIVYAVLNHSFRWCQSHAATHCGTSFHSVVSVEALALRGTRTKIYLFQKFTAIEKYKI